MSHFRAFSFTFLTTFSAHNSSIILLINLKKTNDLLCWKINDISIYYFPPFATIIVNYKSNYLCMRVYLFGELRNFELKTLDFQIYLNLKNIAQRFFSLLSWWFVADNLKNLPATEKTFLNVVYQIDFVCVWLWCICYDVFVFALAMSVCPTVFTETVKITIQFIIY